MDWSIYPNFSEAEFKDSVSGVCLMKPEFIQLLQEIRNIFNREMMITSGYRSVEHPLERDKRIKGEHTTGLCADIHVYGKDALDLIRIALDKGIERIGIMQKGAFTGRFIHLGIGNRYFPHFPAGVWTY